MITEPGSANESKPAISGQGEPARDPWFELKQYTAARIALGSTGVSVPVKEVLQFKLAHAHARDAVFSCLDENQLKEGLGRLSLTTLLLRSQARDRSEYLQRPDRGRTLDAASLEAIEATGRIAADIAVVIADGLSAEAVNRHALPLLAILLPAFQHLSLSLAPVSLVTQGRVAIADEIGEGLKAQLSLVLIGERPGLSSPDSLGIYITYKPHRGLTDESRNCVSNVRPEGLDYHSAAGKIIYLIREALRLQLTGIALKEETQGLPGPALPRA